MVTLVSVVADYALVVTVEILPQQLERVRPLVVALVLNDNSETQSFTYSYMAADMWLRNEIDNERGRKEGNVLFNDALNTFYLRLYGVRHMVKDHSDSEKGNPLLPHRLLFPINSKGSFICTIPETG